ncbi:MAG: hypothetical protein H7Y09_03765 [Chitinophagaceae bacterium]|nr:hypothetical protein [Anaerolineae bacterium]
MKPINKSTKPVRLLPRRLANGLLAWQATLAYISAQQSPDALLELMAYPAEDGHEVQWSAAVSWGKKKESVRDLPSPEAALDSLWQEVERNHVIFISEEDTMRRPSGYAPNEWIDPHTAEILGRFIETTQAIFSFDWRVIIIYHATESPLSRVQMRLLAEGNTVTAGGRGPALIDATRDLYRNAAPAYAAHTMEEIPAEDKGVTE